VTSILIIDDNPLNLKLARVVLCNAGFAVHEANAAEQAIEMLEHLHPDLMLVDLQLPGMDGLELTRRVKADPQTAAIKVVAFTSFAMRDDAHRAHQAGCDSYITKPIDTRQLPDIVRTILADPVAIPAVPG
jgi:CheY-like chemotaxis protein